MRDTLRGQQSHRLPVSEVAWATIIAKRMYALEQQVRVLRRPDDRVELVIPRSGG